MKSIVLTAIIASAILFTPRASAQTAIGDKEPAYGLPALHTINTVRLGPAYGCNGNRQDPYNGPALFLSDYSKRRNSPDLLFNGACGSQDEFESSTAGDDMALIADLGEGINLEGLDAQKAFNTQRVHSYDLYSRFAQVAPVRVNHTYAALVNKAEIRALFVFSVVSHVPNSEVVLRYAVKEYQVILARAASPGFDWAKGNQ